MSLPQPPGPSGSSDPYDPSRPVNPQLSRPATPPPTPLVPKFELGLGPASFAGQGQQQQQQQQQQVRPISAARADGEDNAGAASFAGKHPFHHARSSSRSPVPSTRMAAAHPSEKPLLQQLDTAMTEGDDASAAAAAVLATRSTFADVATPETSFKALFPPAAGFLPSDAPSSSLQLGPLPSRSPGPSKGSYIPPGARPTAQMAAGDMSRSFFDSEAFWLALYFFFNLGLTLFNKIVLVSFPFPYTLTALHTLSGCVGSYIALERGFFTPAQLSPMDNLKLAAFSVLYTVNILVSNLSLQLVTVPFHQVVRAATPLFIIAIGVVFLRQSLNPRKLLSLVPVIGGVAFATYGEYGFTRWGLLLTLLGTFLAALKTVGTNQLQTSGIRLHPLDLLMRMSPLAFVQCVAFGWAGGELDRVRVYGAARMDRAKAAALIVNGLIAFGLNVVSFTANKKTSALTMTVAANVKQVLTIVLAVIIFNLTITPTNGLGIALTLLGGALYAWIEHREKAKKGARRAAGAGAGPGPGGGGRGGGA